MILTITKLLFVISKNRVLVVVSAVDLAKRVIKVVSVRRAVDSDLKDAEDLEATVEKVVTEALVETAKVASVVVVVVSVAKDVKVALVETVEKVINKYKQSFS